MDVIGLAIMSHVTVNGKKVNDRYMGYLAYSFDPATFTGILIVLGVFILGALPVLVVSPVINPRAKKWPLTTRKAAFGISLLWFLLVMVGLVVTLIKLL